MAFGFGLSPVDSGQLDPSTAGLLANLQQPALQAAAPQQPAQQAGPPEGYKPSWWDVAQGMLWNSQSPAEAAIAARQRHYQEQQQQILLGALQSAPPDQQMAMLLNPGETGKALADRFATHTLSGGQTLVNGGRGGSPFTATTYGVDNSTPYALGPNVPGGFQSGPQMPGKTEVDAASGALFNNQGPTGQVFGRPQVVAPGSSLQDYRGSVGPAGSGAPAPPQGQAPAGGLDPIAFFKGFVLPHEGGLNPSDMNGSPTKYGINQAANPGVNVASLHPDQAAQIFRDKYWAQSGAANLPAPLAAVHADTYFINPKMAQTFLQQSGGDPNAYLALRENWMNRMVQTNPKAATYAKAWSQRNADLGQFIAQAGGGQPQQQQQGGPGVMPAQATPLVQGRQPRTLSAQEAQAAGFAPGAVVEQAPDGSRSVKQAPEYGAENRSAIRNQVLTSEEYKQAKAAMSAYQAMMANADKMSGPSAYSMLDTFARAINPGAVARPQVIQTLEHSLGPLNSVEGGWDRVLGQGNLTPKVRQQILNAVLPFAQAHWDQANALNGANAELATRHGFDPADVTAPLEERPAQMVLGAVPPPQQRPVAIYSTPKGPLLWTGNGWRKPN